MLNICYVWENINCFSTINKRGYFTMVIQFKYLGIFCVCLLLLSGCATMANIDQQISVTSQPDDAEVKMGNLSGSTPMTATVPGGYSIPQQIQVSKEGYQPQTVAVQRGFRTGALIQDIIPGLLLGPIPLLVDAISGDWWYVANSSYHVRLQPIKRSSPDNRSETK